MRGSIRSVLLAGCACFGCVLASGVSSMAAPQLEAKKGGVVGALRDDLLTPPSNAQYGADILAQNTVNNVTLTIGATEISSPQFDVFLGIKLHSNPPTAANCTVATGYVTFVDFQSETTIVKEVVMQTPVYADDLIAPWRLDIRSALCAEKPNVITISGVGLYFPTLTSEARGAITGKYEQHGANCSAGGVKLDMNQPGLLVNGANVEPKVNEPFLCFVSANNYVFPKAPVGLGVLEGEIKNN